MENGSQTEFRKRLHELESRADHLGRFLYTDFLSEEELSVYYEREKEFAGTGGRSFGGYEGAERKVLCFGDAQQIGYEEAFPIVCIVVRPLARHFAEPIAHRDILGALMSLGIERKMLGDLLITDDAVYVFAMEKMAEFLCRELSQIKHSYVEAKVEEVPDTMLRPTLKELTLNVASERIDNVIAVLCKLSRSAAQGLFAEKRVYLNGRQMEHYTGLLKEDDRLSIRGYGKFIYRGVGKVTRKERLCIRVDAYQ